jgi:hypothetical protein
MERAACSIASGYLQEEPDAGKPHVRICEGENRMVELLDHLPRIKLMSRAGKEFDGCVMCKRKEKNYGP